MNQDVISFVLRFVREAGEDQQARWRGVVKHVQGDAEQQFTQFAEAMTFMQDHVNELVQTSFSESAKLNEANPFMETTRLWGEYMPKYAEMMMNSMGDAAQQSMNFTQQVEKAMSATLSAWGLPTQQDQEETAVSITKLTDHINSLTDKIAELEAQIEKYKKE